MFPGMADRLQKELTALAPSTMVRDVARTVVVVVVVVVVFVVGLPCEGGRLTPECCVCVCSFAYRWDYWARG